VLSIDSLHINNGERVALLGLNGSGKTTLLQAVVGLIPFQGSITVCGIPVVPSRFSELRKQVGFLFSTPEDQLLLPLVIDDVAFSLRSTPTLAEEKKSRSLSALRKVGADHLAYRPPFQLSHGEQLRVAIAGALVSQPPLVLLDEPSAGLDPPARKQLASYLTSVPQAMLIATHDLAFARRCCTRFLVLEKGSILRDTDNPAQLDGMWNG
jgi:energy-coupling factor transporter ATP-binding protein EcfA2